MKAYLDSRFQQQSGELRRENVAMHEETRRHFDVVGERLEHKIAFLAEGFQMNADKVKAVDEKCEENTAALDSRVTRLEAANTRRR